MSPIFSRHSRSSMALSTWSLDIRSELNCGAAAAVEDVDVEVPELRRPPEEEAAAGAADGADGVAPSLTAGCACWPESGSARMSNEPARIFIVHRSYSEAELQGKLQDSRRGCRAGNDSQRRRTGNVGSGEIGRASCRE